MTPSKPSIQRSALRRFRRSRTAVIGAVLLIITVTLAFGADVLTPYRYDIADFANVWAPPSLAHPFGADKLGRDLLSRIIYGTRTTLTVALTVQAIQLTIGITLGSLAGILGGWVDWIVLRMIDVIVSLPGLLLAILIMALLGAGMGNVILALTLTGWILSCQLTRAQILSLRERDFVIASQAFGASIGWLVRAHMMPNISSPLIVNAVLGMSTVAIAEAGLSFLGVGINPPTPSLGQLIFDASAYLLSHPSYMLYTTLSLSIVILSLGFVGDGLREMLDPSAVFSR